MFLSIFAVKLLKLLVIRLGRAGLGFGRFIGSACRSAPGIGASCVSAQTAAV